MIKLGNASPLRGTQSVALNINPGRFTSTTTLRSLIGTLSTTCGNAPLETVNAAVCGSMAMLARTTTFPKWNGPAFAGTTIERPNGWPLYGPVRYTRPSVIANGSSPGTTTANVVPI